MKVRIVRSLNQDSGELWVKLVARIKIN